MIKETIAALILIAIAVGGIFNLRAADRLSSELRAELAVAEQQLENGEEAKCEKAVIGSLSHWMEKEGYCHTMLRHEDIDNVSEAYYELLEALQNGDNCSSLFASLNERIDRLTEAEHPKLSSIL